MPCKRPCLRASTTSPMWASGLTITSSLSLFCSAQQSVGRDPIATLTLSFSYCAVGPLLMHMLVLVLTTRHQEYSINFACCMFGLWWKTISAYALMHLKGSLTKCDRNKPNVEYVRSPSTLASLGMHSLTVLCISYGISTFLPLMSLTVAWASLPITYAWSSSLVGACSNVPSWLPKSLNGMAPLSQLDLKISYHWRGAIPRSKP